MSRKISVTTLLSLVREVRRGSGDQRPLAVAGARELLPVIARQLREVHNISAGVMVIDGGVWLRVSAQIYNEIEDYMPLAAIGRSLIREFGV